MGTGESPPAEKIGNSLLVYTEAVWEASYLKTLALFKMVFFPLIASPHST